MTRSKAIGISLLSIVVLILSQVIAQVTANIIYKAGVIDWICNILSGILYVILTFLFLKLIMEKIMHLSLSDYCISRSSPRPLWILAGFLLPVLVSLCYILMFSGEFVSSGLNNSKCLNTLSLGIFFIGIGSGFVEEMVFRGVILHALEKAWGTGIAIIAPSVLFGAIHIIGMGFSPLSCLLVILAGTAVGIMFSLITVESGSVWNSSIVHSLWNIIIIGGILHIGSEKDDEAVMSYVLNNRSFPVTGGDFGIESSVVSLIGYIIVSFIAFMITRKKKA